MRANSNEYSRPSRGDWQAPPLPYPVWRSIVDHLQDSLPTLLDLASLSKGLQDICRPHISTLFEGSRYRQSHVASDFPYHHLLRLIFNGDVDPELIHSFYYANQQRTSEKFSPSPTARPGLPENAGEDDVQRFDRDVDRALESSPLIPTDLHSEVCTRFRYGGHDAALLILLPMLTRLKMLEIPTGSPLCAAFFESLAKEHAKRGTIASRARDRALSLARKDRTLAPGCKSSRADADTQPPLSELLILWSEAPDHGCGIALADAMPYMTVPSLQRIVLQGVCNDFPGWKDVDARPSCPSIFFQQSNCTKPVALEFASGLNAPCEVRQWYERHKIDHGTTDVQSIGWDRILVTSEIGGGKKVEASIEFEGGNPGYEHPWVSWLHRGKMLDWRRMDEEFALEDGDEEDEWLQGMLCW